MQQVIMPSKTFHENVACRAGTTTGLLSLACKSLRAVCYISSVVQAIDNENL